MDGDTTTVKGIYSVEANEELERVMHSDMNKIRYTLEKLDRDAFYKSVDAMLDAKTIYIIGARSSEPIAKILNYNLSLIFDNVRFINASASAEVFEQMFSIGEKDVLIAFSFPRYSSRVANAGYGVLYGLARCPDQSY